MKFGVPIIAMPMKVDQPLNAKIVEYIGMGMEAARDEDGKLQSKEIAKAIRKVVVEESGEVVRKIAKELSQKMKAKGDEEIDGVVEELVALSNNKYQQQDLRVITIIPYIHVISLVVFKYHLSSFLCYQHTFVIKGHPGALKLPLLME
ncbi:hypothetical protein T459_29569 [Capsicum annuum]|uniref:Cyanidin-3-O-glucoside 2-O-glucuronosyltransferase-like n=1 Tax=Capsicum annuum TaxID=4072 RepID=A0A2G2Y5Y4_CAPAN|nr:hypothetical protein T459_29569 [Capsicum annuum]